MGKKRGNKRNNKDRNSQPPAPVVDDNIPRPEVVYVSPDLDQVALMYEEGVGVDFLKPGQANAALMRYRQGSMTRYNPTTDKREPIQMSQFELEITKSAQTCGLKVGFGDAGVYFMNGGDRPVAFFAWGKDIAYVCSEYLSEKCGLHEMGAAEKAFIGACGLKVAPFSVVEEFQMVAQKPDFPGDEKPAKKELVRTYHSC